MWIQSTSSLFFSTEENKVLFFFNCVLMNFLIPVGTKVGVKCDLLDQPLYEKKLFLNGYCGFFFLYILDLFNNWKHNLLIKIMQYDQKLLNGHWGEIVLSPAGANVKTQLWNLTSERTPTRSERLKKKMSYHVLSCATCLGNIFCPNVQKFNSKSFLTWKTNVHGTK